MWKVCQPGNDYFDVILEPLTILNTTELCRPHAYWWRQERCSRSVIEALVPLLVQKTILKLCVHPFVFLICWSLSKKASDTGELNLFGFATTRVLWPHSQITALVTMTDLALLWGPFMPVLLVLVVLAIAAQKLLFVVGTRVYEVPLSIGSMYDAQVSCSYLRLHLAMGVICQARPFCSMPFPT